MFPARDFVTHHGFQIAHCPACGFDVTSPQPGIEELGAYYPAGYYGDAAERRFPWLIEVLQKALYARRVRVVESVGGAGPGRVLDIGCGRGLLLAAFRQRGWQTQGTELSEPAARYARQVAGVTVEIGRVEEIGFPANQFDAVTMWHVLEHVHDPRVVLAEANRILKPGGVLLVGVPNFSGLEARFFRDKWFHLDVPRHITHLTKAMLKSSLREHGFQDRRWSGFAPEYDAFSFVQSALNGLGLRHNLLYNLLRGKQAKILDGERTPRWHIAASLFLGAALGILSVPATLCAGLLEQAGTMTVLAVKNKAS
jgi:2-polyprenyl-3-methyl-5-hydroxy-6-metoxy-1,4-benzoquinol methylase